MTAKDLKNALLQEAVQGKLVPQIASEGNAKDLLEEIKKEKAKLVKEGKLKKEKPLPEITEEDIPFDIPENWCWCRLGEIVNKLTDGTHRTPKYVEKGIPFLSVRNLSSGKIDFENTKYITPEEHKELYARCNPEKGDMLLTKVGTTGIPVINDSDIEFSLFVSVALIKFNHDLLDEKFFLYLLQSPLVQEQAKENTRGVGNKNWVMDAIANTLLALPPLAEQKRIVDAIEKFMPLIEEYGKKETELKAFNKQIGTLTKKAILQEAVQGKLVPQITTEGNAKDLLEEIRKEKLSHGFDFANAKSGKKRKETALTGSNPCDIPEDEIPFDIPENWCWCRWGDLSYSIQYGYNASAKDKGRIKMVRISDIHENEVIWDSVPYCDIKEDEIKTYLLKENDILFARTGGTVGKSFLVKNIPCEAIYAGYLIRTHYNTKNLVPEFLKFFMESDLYWSQLREGTIATAQPNCNGQTLSKMMIPLPPLAEQKRIVNKLNNLISQCERLTRE